jgi:CheY-like chemotaxis protein
MAGERILIVDDNPANVVLISFLLTAQGYEIRTAADASQTLTLLQSFHPSLILMDVQLPGMDGLELTRRLKGDPATREIVVVALTAYAMKTDEQRVYQAGCDGYLTKPINTRTFPATVAGFLHAGAASPSSPRAGNEVATPVSSEAMRAAESNDDPERAVILVVDDQATNRALIRAHLGSRYLLREAISGAAALEIIKGEAIDLVLLDVMMPHMSGFGLCRLIKQLPAEGYLPVILLTALGQHEDRLTGLEAGADDFLTKPVNREELLLRVQTFVKLRQQDTRIRKQLLQVAERDRIIRGQLEELQALDVLKDELVSLLVHDLRNPLGGIVGFLGALENEAEQDHTRSDARSALEASDRLREMLDDLLQVRLLESGTVRIHRETVEAHALVNDAIASVGGAARARQVEIAVAPLAGELPSDLPVVADRKLIRRAIENLLTNAVKYSPAGGVVSAGVRKSGGDVEFEIADRGTKIPDDFKDQLFRKFGSVEAARGGTRRGFGMGLYLVKLVADAHGGHTTVRDREGGGTSFGLVIPAA